jgi:hypothetical protein
MLNLYKKWLLENNTTIELNFERYFSKKNTFEKVVLRLKFLRDLKQKERNEIDK